MSVDKKDLSEEVQYKMEATKLKDKETSEEDNETCPKEEVVRIKATPIQLGQTKEKIKFGVAKFVRPIGMPTTPIQLGQTKEKGKLGVAKFVRPIEMPTGPRSYTDERDEPPAELQSAVTECLRSGQADISQIVRGQQGPSVGVPSPPPPPPPGNA